MSPRTRKKHEIYPPPDSDIFEKPRLPYQERAGPSFSGERRQKNSEQISGRKAVTKTDGLTLGPARRWRDGDGNTNEKDVRISTTATSTSSLPCWPFSAFNSTSSSINPESEGENEEEKDEDGGAELEHGLERERERDPGSSIPSFTFYDDSQFRPREGCSNVNNCHDCQDHHRDCDRKQRRGSSKRMQLLSDSEISVLDLGPSLCVSGASRCAPEAEYGEKVQKDSVIGTRRSSEAEILMVVGAGATIPITSTNGPRCTNPPTQEKKKDHAYGREGCQTSTFTEQRIGECGHCGNNGGYRSSASGHALVAPETGDARMRRCRVDGAGDHECDCDYQYYDYDNDYDYGYGYDYGDDGGRDAPSVLTTTKMNSTATTISSPILAPLKTTREEPQPPPA